MSLCQITHYTQNTKSLQEHAEQHTISQTIEIGTHDMRKGARSCTCHKASYTLEAAVILPLLAAFFAFLLFFFRVLQLQTAVQSALCCAGRKTACEACVTESEPVLFAAAEVYFQAEIRKYPAVKKYVPAGVSLLRSDFSGNHVELKADYFVKLPINFFEVRGFYTSQGEKIRKWTGDKNNGAAEDYVYVTENGTVYHCSRDCHYLDLSIRTVDFAALAGLRNKGGHKYSACAACAAKHADGGIVYITDYGTCYHTNLSCSGLKRTIYLIPISEVGNRGPCSKCGQSLTGG